MLWKVWGVGGDGSMFTALWVEADTMDTACRKARAYDEDEYWAATFQPMDAKETEFAEGIGGIIR